MGCCADLRTCRLELRRMQVSISSLKLFISEVVVLQSIFGCVYFHFYSADWSLWNRNCVMVRLL